MNQLTKEELEALLPETYKANNNDAPNIIHIVVLGEPKSQKRHRHVRFKNMNFSRTYDPSQPDKKDFLSIIQDRAPAQPFDCPIHVDLLFYFSRPKSHFRSGKNAHLLKESAPKWHTSKPDVDNLFKFVTDAMTKVYWRDDSLICSSSVMKLYDEKMPRTEIIIRPL